MMPMVLLGLVAMAAAVPTELVREESHVTKEENLIPIYKPGFTHINHNLPGMYNPLLRRMEHDHQERQLLPYRHYYGKEQSPLAYKRNYFARYIDIDEPEYYQNEEYYQYDPETSFYKQDYNREPTYNHFKKYFPVPYAHEYFYNAPYSYKYNHLYNPYSFSQQYKQYYNYYPYIRQQQYYSPLYHHYPNNQYYHHYPQIYKQRSVEYVKPTAYEHMIYKNVLPNEQSNESPLATTVSKRILAEPTPVQQTWAGKVQYVNKDLADKIVETPFERKVFVQVQPIVSKTLKVQPILEKPIAQHEDQIVGKSLGFDQETTTYYKPLAYGQQNLFGKYLTYESLPTVGKVLPYQQQRIGGKSQIYNQQPIVGQDLEHDQQSNWGKVLYTSQLPSKSYYTQEIQPIRQLYIQKEQPAAGKIYDYDQHQFVQGQEFIDQQSLSDEQIAHDKHYQPIYGKGYDQLLDNFQRWHSIA